MHSRTPLVARKLSPTVSFSAYGTSTVTRLKLKKRAEKWSFFFLFFSNAVATRNGLLVKPVIELWPLPCRAHFRARREPGIPLVLTYHPTNALVKKIITRNLYLVRDDRETATIFQPLRILCEYRRYSNLRDSFVRSALDNTRAISIWISL